jgi:hypothetical protein
MNYNEYREMIMRNYTTMSNASIKDINVDILYDEKFEWKWIATKLKMFSFIGFSENITEDIIKQYSKECFQYGLNNYKGLVRGMQNGFVSFAVLASENVHESALSFLKKSPPKHFAAFEMPIIFDLNSKELLFYKKTPMWGGIYYKYFREYIEKSFSVKE